MTDEKKQKYNKTAEKKPKKYRSSKIIKKKFDK